MKKRRVIIYVVLMLTLLCTSVYATVSGSASLTASPSGTVCAGDEINVTFTLSDIVADNGIDSVRLYIDIDENVIDSITVDNFVTNNGTITIGGNSLTVKESTSATAATDTGIWLTTHTSEDNYDNDYVVIINFSTPITTTTDLFTITFNVSDDASTGTYNDAIQYSGIYIYYGSSVANRNTVTSQSLDVVVGTTSGNTNNATNNANTNNANTNNANKANNNANTNNSNKNTNNTNNNANNNSNSNSNKNTNSNTNNSSSGTTNSNTTNDSDGTSTTTDTTTAVGSLPNTGFKLLLIPILLAVVTGLICYRKYNKYNKF